MSVSDHTRATDVGARHGATRASLVQRLTDTRSPDNRLTQSRRTGQHRTGTPAAGLGVDGWARGLRARLLLSDAAVLAYALVGAHLIRFGTASPDVGTRGSLGLQFTYAPLTVAIGLVWFAALHLADSRNPKIAGIGTEEYRRIFSASAKVFATLAVVGYLSGLDIARGYLAIAAPIGTVLLLVERWLWRQWLVSHRRLGRSVRRVLAVGSEADVDHIAVEMARVPDAGLRVVGACTFDGTASGPGGVPVLGSIDSVAAHARSGTIDAVAVASSGPISRDLLRKLSWTLEGTGVALMVAPALANVAGKRIHVQPVAGLALLHVEEPRLPRGGQVAKDLTDRLGAGAMVLALSPLLLVLAVLVRLTSQGPAFFRQERIGRDGKVFRVWKFRSMRTNADDELAALLKAAGRADTPLFKLDADPRITGIGQILRRYSLDELPQLFNVVAGDMSLVGPRPQRASEVELYDDLARRRLLAKPGMTGYWQVSGRSALAWEEAVRLDLYYVENWSYSFDLVLLWRTVWAVAKGSGAQ